MGKFIIAQQGKKGKRAGKISRGLTAPGNNGESPGYTREAKGIPTKGGSALETAADTQAAPTSQSQAMKKRSRQIWLNYFNDYLYSKGVISQEDMRKMRRLIQK